MNSKVLLIRIGSITAAASALLTVSAPSAEAKVQTSTVPLTTGIAEPRKLSVVSQSSNLVLKRSSSGAASVTSHSSHSSHSSHYSHQSGSDSPSTPSAPVYTPSAATPDSSSTSSSGENTSSTSQGEWTVHHAGPVPSFHTSTNAPDDPKLLEFVQHIKDNDIGKVRHMVDADHWLVSAADMDGKTGLHYAAQSLRTDIASMLIDDGADVNAVTKNSEAPIDLIPWDNYTYDADTATLNLLLAHGADANGFSSIPSIVRIAKATSEFPFLTDAAILSVIKHGADLEAVNSKGDTLLLFAISNQLVDTANALLDGGASATVKDKAGDTALHIIAKVGSKFGESDETNDLIDKLISKGCDVNAEDNDGDTAVDIAIKIGNTGISDHLKASGGKA